MLERLYPYLFFAILLGYCLFYAPYGINETDGGFLTGLGWQVLSGKTLYHDIVYVRPPLPVWLRAGEMVLLPDTWSVLGERYFFYCKIALYTWLAADVLAKGSDKWVLAILGFVVSVHSYPACAWHTVDGILFSVLALWLYAKGNRSVRFTWLSPAFAGLSFCAALLCKQSFYPLIVAFPLLFLLWDHTRKKQRMLGFFVGAFFGMVLFFNYLHQNNLLENYVQMTGAATSGGQALQHGLLDYLRIKPSLALFTVLLLGPVLWWFWKQNNLEIAGLAWSLWLGLLPANYVLELWKRLEFTAPFSQARLLFLTGAAFAFWQIIQHWKRQKQQKIYRFRLPENSALLLLLLAISWSASVSWGYNLPILLATPWVFTTMQISRTLWEAENKKVYPKWLQMVSIILLLGIARFSYEFVYRDGPRSTMSMNLGAIFPKLNGIYSSPETADLYRELQNLSQRYGPDFAVLPAFPQAHFLTNTTPLPPLDWVVQREMNESNQLIINILNEKKPILFIEKSFAEKISNDPELELTRQALEKGKMLKETHHFWIVRYE